MALSGSFQNAFSAPYYHHIIYVEWSATQSIPNNCSYVTVNVYYKIDYSGSSIAIGSRLGSISTDGQTYNYTATATNISGVGQKLEGTYVFTIPHNSDGSKQISISCPFNVQATINSTYYGTVTANSGTITLDSIPRASYISSLGNFEIEDSIPVSIYRYDSGFTHTLTLKNGSTTILERTGIGTSTTIVPTTSVYPSASEITTMYNQVLNTSVLLVTMYCQTYYGATPIGSPTSVSIYMSVKSTIVPTFTTVTHSESVVANDTGLYIKLISILNCAITGASGVKGSTITGYLIQVDGKNINASSGQSNVLVTSGTWNIVGTVTDSRSRTFSRNVSITVTNYALPQITSFDVKRATVAGVIDPIGTYARYICTVGVSTLMNVTQRNMLRYVIQKSVRGSGSWSTVVDTSAPSGTISYTDRVDLASGYPIDVAYDVKLTLYDKFNNQVSVDTLGTGVVTMDWRDGKLGIGKIWENGVLDVGGDIYANGVKVNRAFQEIYDAIYPVGAIYISVGSTSPATLFGGTWEALGGSFLIGANGTYTAGSTGGSATVTLDVTQIPSHTHIQDAHGHRARYSLSMPSGTASYHSPTSTGTLWKDENTWIENTTAVNQNTGGGLSHNNMPPYLAVYMWKRTSLT